MPIRVKPKVEGCDGPFNLECAKRYSEAFLPEDDDDEIFKRPQIIPEETEDYIEAKARYEDHIRRMDEALTVFDGLYWRRLFSNMKKIFASWTACLNRKVIVLVKELAACMVTGGIFVGVLYILLTILGPVRLKTLGAWIVTFVIGSICVTESIEMAASALIGMTLILFIFFTKLSTGNRVLEVKNRSLKNKLNENSVYVFIDFWYAGSRTVWINLSQRIIGVL